MYLFEKKRREINLQLNQTRMYCYGYKTHCNHVDVQFILWFYQFLYL
jgi:hypothetical protein